MAERKDSTGTALGTVERESFEPDLDFRYTDMTKAPQHHVTVAYQFAMGIQVWDISISTGYDTALIERILRHPPVIAAVAYVKEALNQQVLQSLNTWTKLLDKSIGVLDKSLKSTNERVALTAAIEYLDRHPSGMFIKRKQADGSGGMKVIDNNAVEELKRHALQLKGEQDGRLERSEDPATGGDGGEWNAGIDARSAIGESSAAAVSDASAGRSLRPERGGIIEETGTVPAPDIDSGTGPIPAAAWTDGDIDASTGGTKPSSPESGGSGRDAGTTPGKEDEGNLEIYDPI